MLKKIKATMLGALALAVTSGAADAQSKVTLRVADSLPVGHIISASATKPWIELVRELSKGSIEIQYFPAEQLGKAKDFLQLTQSGLVDVGYVGPSYVADKMPLSAVAELPGAFSSACQVMTAYWQLVKEGGFLYEQEFKPNKIRPLFIVALPPYQAILGASVPAVSLQDLAGKKIRAAGGAQDLTLRKLGMVPVRMAPPEIYESLGRGTVDGALLALISVESYKLTDVTKSVTSGQNFGTVVVSYSISEAKWNSLPQVAREVLTRAGDETTRRACKAFDREEADAADRLKKDGVKIVRLNATDQAKVEAVMVQVAEDWATALDARGKPGSAALKAFRSALTQASQ